MSSKLVFGTEELFSCPCYLQERLVEHDGTGEFNATKIKCRSRAANSLASDMVWPNFEIMKVVNDFTVVCYLLE